MNNENENENEIIYYFHDLRNKMSQAKSCMYVAMDDHEDLKENQWLNLCTEAIDRGTKILNDGLHTFTSDRMSATLNQELIRVELQEFTSALIQQPYNHGHAQCSLEFTIEYRPSDIPKFININPQKLYRLRDNIVDNAIEAGATSIHTTIQMKDNYFIITCVDNGKGMTQDQIDEILVNKYSKNPLHGFGTQYLLDTIKAHNSSITITSELNKSTTLRIVCPYAD